MHPRYEKWYHLVNNCGISEAFDYLYEIKYGMDICLAQCQVREVIYITKDCISRNTIK